jgi:hypothetical protein
MELDVRATYNSHIMLDENYEVRRECYKVQRVGPVDSSGQLISNVWVKTESMWLTVL